jgi:hypothetical protein
MIIVTTHVLAAELPKPDALDAASWAAILDPFERLRRNAQADDRPAIVGSAKDLVEAVARVVLSARGQPAGSDESYDKVLGDAHRLIERQPGPGLALDAAVRQAATAARKVGGPAARVAQQLWHWSWSSCCVRDRG